MKQLIGSKESNILFSLSGHNLAKVVLSQPIGAFIACVVLSLIYDFEASTATHCRVANYLPSISAAIGGFKPQCYIWRVCIGLHCAPRFMIAIMYYNHFKGFSHLITKQGLYNLLVPVNCLFNVAENACLVLLTYISSTDNHDVHEGCFIGFMLFSELYMLLTLILFKWSRGQKPWSKQDQKSYNYKSAFFIANISSFAAAVYFFFRHNAYCEPGVYTLFSLCEYLVVLTNISFHASAVCDFGFGHLCYIAPKHNRIYEEKRT